VHESQSGTDSAFIFFKVPLDYLEVLSSERILGLYLALVRSLLLFPSKAVENATGGSNG
jgi:hypothetical protein